MTQLRVVSETTVRPTLALMSSCGAATASGEFAFHVGLPVKTSLHGALITVSPGLFGVCTYAQDGSLCESNSNANSSGGDDDGDAHGSGGGGGKPSGRADTSAVTSPAAAPGMRFSHTFARTFSLHCFALAATAQGQSAVRDPRRGRGYRRGLVLRLLLAAGRGDLFAVQSALAARVSVDAHDDAGRSALHVAAENGRSAVVDALLAWGANPAVRDDSGETPADATARALRQASAATATAAADVAVESSGSNNGAGHGGARDTLVKARELVLRRFRDLAHKTASVPARKA